MSVCVCVCVCVGDKVQGWMGKRKKRKVKGNAIVGFPGWLDQVLTHRKREKRVSNFTIPIPRTVQPCRSSLFRQKPVKRDAIWRTSVTRHFFPSSFLLFALRERKMYKKKKKKRFPSAGSNTQRWVHKLLPNSYYTRPFLLRANGFPSRKLRVPISLVMIHPSILLPILSSFVLSSFLFFF